MPENSVISKGKTTNEAIENGLKILKVSKEMVNIKVLENDDKRSFFSILAPRVVQVELTLKDNKTSNAEKQHEENNIIKKEKKPVTVEQLDKSEENLKMFLDKFFLEISENIKYEIIRNEYGFEIIVNGKEASIFIGYRGETLYAFQNIVSAIANKGSSEKIRVLVDIEHYKEKREKTLQDLAIKVSKTVQKTRKPVTLEPMQAYERKIIHSILQDSEVVKTESIGEEPRRRVVISLK